MVTASLLDFNQYEPLPADSCHSSLSSVDQVVGSIYTTHNATLPSGPLTWGSLVELAARPDRTKKAVTRLIVLSMANGKQKSDILTHNAMTGAWCDIDSGNVPLADLVFKVEALGLAAVIYSTSSANRIKEVRVGKEEVSVLQGNRWRIIFLLAESLNCEPWLLLQESLAQEFGGGMEAVRVTQGLYAPANADGGYYEHAIVDGAALDPNDLPAAILARIPAIKAVQAQDREVVRKAPQAKRIAVDGDSIIELVNKAYSVRDLVEAEGHRQCGRNRYLHRDSTSGTPGIIILEDGGRSYYFSHHSQATDPLADGHRHDAFDLLVHWQYNGDLRRAVKELADELDPAGQKQRRKEWKAQQEPVEEAEQPEECATPEPLTNVPKPVPFPIDALPATMRAAIEEIVAFVQCPLPMAAASARATLSQATQGLADVQRAEGLSGPISTFDLVIADSGERKTQVDKHLQSPIREYDAAEKHKAAPLLKQYQADMRAWESRESGLQDAIRKAARGNSADAKLTDQARDLYMEKQVAPIVPRIALGDETPESLAYELAHSYPCASVVSSEAGVIFGSHGMGKDSALRNLSQLNVLWDGGELQVGRRSAARFTVRDARLTCSLQVQQDVLKLFIERTGREARGSGFWARNLITYPESTMGSRMFKEPPTGWPALNAFKAQIADLLAIKPKVIDNDGLLSVETVMLTLTDEAKQVWVEYHDAIETQLSRAGDLFDVRDIAAKSADNAARIAAQFHLLKYRLNSLQIQAEEMAHAVRIAAWHLHDAVRLFAVLEITEDTANAAALEAWLISECRHRKVREINVGSIQKAGPNKTRRKDAMDEALAVLESKARARVVARGKGRVVVVHPAILSGEVA